MTSTSSSLWKRTSRSLATPTVSKQEAGSSVPRTAGGWGGGGSSFSRGTAAAGGAGAGGGGGGGAATTVRGISSYSSRAPTNVSSGSSAIGAGDDRASMPSFWSIWTTRRMVRQLTSRLRNRRRPAAGGEGGLRPGEQLEPTFRMEPKRPFNSSQVERILRDVLEAHLHDFVYQARRCSILSRILTEEIKDRVKGLKFERYKIVCVVTLGEKCSQDLRVASRCIWDNKFDKCSTYSWENASAFCTASVYGIYHE